MRIISLKDVRAKTSLGTTSIYELQKAGAFPQSISLGARRVGWVESEIDAWIQARVAASRA